MEYCYIFWDVFAITYGENYKPLEKLIRDGINPLKTCDSIIEFIRRFSNASEIPHASFVQQEIGFKKSSGFYFYLCQQLHRLRNQLYNNNPAHMKKLEESYETLIFTFATSTRVPLNDIFLTHSTLELDSWSNVPFV